MSTATQTETRCPNPECGHKYQLKPEHVGKTASCKACGKRFILTLGVGTAVPTQITQMQPDHPSTPPREIRPAPKSDRRVLTITLACFGVAVVGMATWLVVALRSNTAESELPSDSPVAMNERTGARQAEQVEAESPMARHVPVSPETRPKPSATPRFSVTEVNGELVARYNRADTRELRKDAELTVFVSRLGSEGLRGISKGDPVKAAMKVGDNTTPSSSYVEISSPDGDLKGYLFTRWPLGSETEFEIPLTAPAPLPAPSWNLLGKRLKVEAVIGHVGIPLIGKVLQPLTSDGEIDATEIAAPAEPKSKLHADKPNEAEQLKEQAALEQLLSDIKANPEQPRGQLFSLSEAVVLLQEMLNSEDYEDSNTLGVVTVSKWLTQSVLTDRYGAPDSTDAEDGVALLTYGWLTLQFDEDGKLVAVGSLRKKSKPGEVTTTVLIQEKVGNP